MAATLPLTQMNIEHLFLILMLIRTYKRAVIIKKLTEVIFFIKENIIYDYSSLFFECLQIKVMT